MTATGLVVAGVTGTTATTACTARARWRPPQPLEALLASAKALAARYDATLLRHPSLAGRLTALRDEHHEHAVVLARYLGQPDPPGPGAASPAASPSQDTDGASVPGDPKAAVAALLAAEKAGQQDAMVACLASPFWAASVMGSIVACRATHVEVLS